MSVTINYLKVLTYILNNAVCSEIAVGKYIHTAITYNMYIHNIVANCPRMGWKVLICPSSIPGEAKWQ